MPVKKIKEQNTPQGFKVDFSFEKVIVIIFLFMFVFAIPARLYDLYGPQSKKSEVSGQVAGINTENQWNITYLSKEHKLTDIKFNIITVAGIVTITATLCLIGFYIYEQFQKQKYSSSEL